MTKCNTRIDPDTGETLYQVAICKWITQTEKDTEDALWELAGALAKYFKLKGEKTMGPCACMGIHCHKFACPMLWNLFLRSYSGKLLELIKGLD